MYANSDIFVVIHLFHRIFHFKDDNFFHQNFYNKKGNFVKKKKIR